jgi:predicted RNA-binding protein with RPS1 domain
MSRGEEPVSRHAAQALAQLDDDPDWHNDVWAFWARSHHLALNLDEPLLRGTATEPHPVPAELEIREETPLELRRQALTTWAKTNPVGTIVDAVVHLVTDGFVRVEIDENLPGKIVRDELSWRYITHPADVVEPGDSIRGLVTEIEEETGHVTLSAKQVEADPFVHFWECTDVGSDVQGTVRTLQEYGAFVEVAPGVEGLVHISELANSFVSDPSTVVSEGQEVRVQITKVVADKRRLSLSIKSAEPAGRRSARSERGASKSGRQSRAAGQSTRKRRERAEGPTVSKATKEAAAKLGLDAKQVQTRTLREPKRGLFGRVKQSALVEVTEV